MKTGNDLVAEQVHYSTCLCSLSNYANQRNLAVLQRIVIYLLYSSLGCIDNFLSLHRVELHRYKDTHLWQNPAHGFRRRGMDHHPPHQDQSIEQRPPDGNCQRTDRTLQRACKDDFVFPMPSNGTCNDHLKKIATVCGINKEVTFHLSRHSSFLF